MPVGDRLVLFRVVVYLLFLRRPIVTVGAIICYLIKTITLTCRFFYLLKKDIAGNETIFWYGSQIESCTVPQAETVLLIIVLDKWGK